MLRQRVVVIAADGEDVIKIEATVKTRSRTRASATELRDRLADALLLAVPLRDRTPRSTLTPQDTGLDCYRHQIVVR